MGDDALYVRWNGGGGVGDPLHREPEAVLNDVTTGIVSEQAATGIFGVVIKGDAIDAAATDAKRKALRRERLAARSTT
jgi:N-methylhydantoinase B